MLGVGYQQGTSATARGETTGSLTKAELWGGGGEEQS